jgi:hypothetical protein
MKKFYIPIFTVGFLLTSLLSRAQITYTSIADGNPNGYTLDDPRFWQAPGVPPPNPCNNCIIKIYSNVTMVAQGGGTTSQVPGADDPALNDITVTNSTINLYGATTLTINTYLELFNTTITIGNNPTSQESIFVNDQVDLNTGSTVRLANDLTTVNANNDIGNAIHGPHPDFGHPTEFSAGILSIPAAPTGPSDYTVVLNPQGYGTATNFNPSGYTLNCNPPTFTCAVGLVYGPALTTVDATFGLIFTGSTTLPVDLVQFLALKNGDGSVKLIWATSQEVNAGYFDIERSGDQSAWTKIGSVKAAGNTSTSTNYSYFDKLPVDGTGYYKLKMVDLDGKFKYSKTIAVTVVNDSRPLVVYNNPFSDMIRIKVNVSRAQNLVMTVSDMLGKTYINQNYHAQTGDNLVNLPSSISNHGVYILRIYGESYDQTVKLQKQ